ncbi:chondroitin sulfate proteoglycan 4 isoform X2 [Spodoptera frugiperda]|uniref:Chondroitin sulfate proteoglycan 4 isoform X2 n=1 Tax=Spodoptera frugiperda TaxID=7108 RepID=A0A9R0CWE3_SPOFR|nr:chondroitin sulfate proteoglycan 4 isoform X2 [Spodoptera frugiperda]
MELLLILSVVVAGYAYEKASFYGASYISYPLQEAKGVTDISFRFRTHLADALLLLAAGKTDYCMIRLEGGRLKLHINLGAGESELSSAKGIHLNDSQWHHVSIIRREANLTMKVDESAVKKRLPGRFFELNIHFGIFLGGQGDFSELFLGHMENFRGCMEDVYYNGVKIIEKARSRSGSVHVEGVTWNCAPEFDADLNSDISFVDEGAYLILPKINSRAGGKWQIEFKTIAQNAIILYNAGGGRGSDFLAVEILEGVIRVKMARGQIVHTVRVNDGQWHKMHLSFYPSMIELTVDNIAMHTRIESGGTRYLDLSDSFYLGGIDSEKQQRAFTKGIKAADSSIMGCIKPIEVDEKIYGLPNAVVTYGVSPKCVWWYPCHLSPGNPPCVPQGVCEQHGVDHFTCKCDSDLCINPDYAEKYKIFSKSSSELELVALFPLTVQEGGVSVITTQNIDVVLDHHKYGVRPSGVVLHVAQSPQHGRIAIDLSLQRNSQQYNFIEGETKSKQFFTLLDLSRDKVRYVHDGSENHQDAIVLDMELIPETKFTLPSYLQGRNTFVLHVNVTPVNDPPVLNLLPGKVLRLTQGTRKVITSDILKAEDPDTAPEDLLYTVLHGKNEANSGHIEMSGQPVDSFTQQDIDSGVISYVHGTTNDKQLNKTSLRLTLQVSDGIETSGPGILRISIVPLQVRLVNNTGLQLVHNSYAIISADNLTFTTNADETNVQVKYDIVKPPQFGVVERLRVLDGTWQTVDSFTSEMVTFGRVRYMHLLGNPSHDEFKFKASVGSIRTNTLYDFRLTFIKLELYQSVNEELVLNNTREAFISSQHLTFKTNPLALPSDRVVYTILRPPKYGILHLSSGKHHLQMHSTFTQQHIDTDQLWYRLHRRAYSHIQDEFTFVVGATECKNITGVMTIRHTPGSPSSDRTEGRVHTTLERLQVTEGSRMVIPATHLNFRTDAVTNLIFNITHLPKHGKIEVINDILKVARDNTTYFTLEELNSDRVYYAHDDSESRHDSFHFMALSPEPEDFQYVGVFHIDIILKNDNSPVRANDNVFHIVHGGARLITARDLSYTDADLDTKPSDIIYTVQRYIKDPPNGGIFRADNPSEQIAQFSQDDINKNLVLFKHQGKEYGKMAFWISDGLFDVNGNLEIQASPPFIRMYPSNGSIVENGKAVVITSRDMQVDTNMNCLEEDIRYEITLEPKHGTIEVGEGQGAFTFTQLDVTASRVAYRHREPKTPTDQFRFKVMCLDTWGEGVYVIKIFPSSYWEPLRVTTNLPLVVEESTSVNVTKDILEVMHPQIEPSNIVYQVTDGPYHGWLEITTTPGTLELENYNEEPVHIKVFDQSIINANRLVYVQSGVNRTRDRIRMDVTNGIVWLRDVELNVVIIPEHFYVYAFNLTVVEGEAVSVKPDLFRTITEYYKGKVVAYKVVEKPKYGKIVMADQELNLLPVLKLNSGNIQYINDGSEESSDAFKLVAMTESSKESEPFYVHVNIAPVNDEPPIVAANTGLCVWEGGTFTFTTKELYVNDIDTPPENVTVRVVDIVSGYIAMQGNLDTAVHHFTQADIDKGKVVFVHKNGTKGKMIFNVTDGLHELSKITFLITTKSVSLKLTRKHNMKVFPLMREPLNNYMLMSKCSDPTRTIIYKIERAPTLGRLIMLNGESHHRSIKQFTQQDVNNTVVFYEHTHPFSDLYTNDSFIFTVEAPLAKPLTDQIFNIDISVSSGGLAKYVNIPPIKVQEGDKVPIKVNVSNVITYLETQAGLRQPQIEAQWSQPSHGELKPFMTSLTQSQIESGVVNYEHDDSDTTQDKIDMALFLLPDYVLLCNVSIIIHITPVNDQPFRLLTDTPQIQVVQGENYTITKNDLLTEDADTGPAGIFYDIISGPTQGRMVMLDKNQTIDDAHSINKFTQDDINNGRVIYEHSGILQTATFYFRVWDGQFKPTYTVFTIDVIPVILNATSLHPIYLQQGSNVAAVTTDQIYVDTNAKTSKVLYNITRQPLHGMVYVGRNPVSYFTHKDLMEKVVIYMQNDMTTANDSFDLIAYVHNSNATRPFTIEVIVQPLMTLGDLRVEVEKARITLRTMDASGLAKLTASDPVYTLLRKPRFGTLKKIIRSSGEKTSAREREVAYFTHEDVKAGVIYFVTKKKVHELNGFEDSFRFLLAATIFQPAVGDVKIIIGNRQKKNLPGPNDPESHEGVPVANGEAASYYMMILMALSGTVLAIVVIFGLLKCRRYVMRDQNALVKIHGQSQGAVAPIPLPRPPEHLMPSPSQGTPPIKRYVSSEQSVHTGASTPLPSGGSVACKVTPLADAALPDLNARYPYGTDDHTDAEDWSSYEASESAYPVRATGVAPSNPMLRRNQYWV